MQQNLVKLMKPFIVPILVQDAITSFPYLFQAYKKKFMALENNPYFNEKLTIYGYLLRVEEMIRK